MAIGLPFDATDALTGPGGTLPTGAGTVRGAGAGQGGGGGGLFGLTPQQLAITLAGLADITSVATGKRSNVLGTVLAVEDARDKKAAGQRREEREEKRLGFEEERLDIQRGEVGIRVQESRQKEAKRVMDDAVTYLQGASGRSADDRSTIEHGLLTRMAAVAPQDVATLGIMFKNPELADDVAVLGPYLSEREVNEIKTDARFALRTKEGKQALRVLAEGYASDDVFKELGAVAINVSRRLRAEGKTGMLDRGELRKALTDNNLSASLALFEGTRFSEDVRKAAEDGVTGLGFGPRGAVGEAAKAGAVKAAQTRAEGPVLSQAVKEIIQADGVDPRDLDVSRPADAALIRRARKQAGEEDVEKDVAKQGALLPGKVEEQQALLPGRVAVARQTGAAAAEVAEDVRRRRPVPADAGALIGLAKGTTIGAAEDRGIKVPEGPELARLKEFKVFTEQGQEVIRELDALIAKSPEAIGTSGRVATLVGGLRAQAENFARLSGIQVAASLNPKDYRGTFRGLGITDARIQSNVIALAFPLAVSAQGGGGRLSDKDIDFQIRRIGAQVQDPVAFRAVLADVEGALTRSFDRQIETATGAPRPTSGGSGKGPAAAEIERMAIGQLKTLDPKTLNADQRKALDRALRRLGF